MCKINSSEHNILSYKCNDLKFCEHEFNSAQSANFVSTNLKTPVFICYTYVTQNAHALTHAHEIATKQRHNKQSFSLSLKLKHYCSEYYGTQRTRK